MAIGAIHSTKERPSYPAEDWEEPLRFSNVIILSSYTNKEPPVATTVERHRPKRR